MNMTEIILTGMILSLIVLHVFSALKFRKKVLHKISESPGYTQVSRERKRYRDELLSFLDYSTHAMEEQYALQLMHQKAEFNALQSQINPHFLYNTLDTIRGKAYEDDALEIADMTERLSLLFRYTIGQKDVLITVEEEIQSVENYICIQQYRFNVKYKLQKQIDDADLLEYQIPKLTLQPIVENALKYAFPGKRTCNRIVLQMFKTQTHVVMSISDNGKGMEEQRLIEINELLSDGKKLLNKQKSGSGIALENVNARIKLLFGTEYGLNVYSTVNVGTTVEIILPGVTP